MLSSEPAAIGDGAEAKPDDAADQSERPDIRRPEIAATGYRTVARDLVTRTRKLISADILDEVSQRSPDQAASAAIFWAFSIASSIVPTM
jgi:hypothetical protein